MPLMPCHTTAKATRHQGHHQKPVKGRILIDLDHAGDLEILIDLGHMDVQILIDLWTLRLEHADV